MFLLLCWFVNTHSFQTNKKYVHLKQAFPIVSTLYLPCFRLREHLGREYRKNVRARGSGGVL